MMVEMFVCYAAGTLFGFWMSRSYWMTRGATKLYDLLNEKGLLENER